MLAVSAGNRYSPAGVDLAEDLTITRSNSAILIGLVEEGFGETLRIRPRRIVLIVTLASLVLAPGAVLARAPLVQLAQPGPWSGVSGLIGYGTRLWFVNSVKFVDHNSADVYSYDPRTGDTRYERHLFSQDEGVPAVADGLLFWPFEDPRFSVGHGESTAV